MKNTLSENLKVFKRHLNSFRILIEVKKLIRIDNRRFLKYSFITGNIKKCDHVQLEAQILKTQHSLEKGLALKNTRLGFGLKHINLLESLLLEYIRRGKPQDSDVVKISIDTIKQYLDFHKKEGQEPEISSTFFELQSAIELNEKHGGYQVISKDEVLSLKSEKFDLFVKSRHSIRDFDDTEVNLKYINEAIDIALNTPSVCNRQSWNVRVVSGSYIDYINANQNGNRGFGDKINKYVIVTSDIKSFSKPRERNQAFIDGGLFAMNLLLSLHHKGLATVPMSASLSIQQERNIRRKFELSDSEVLIMFIALGNYPNEFKVAFSKKKNLKPKIFND